MGNPSVVILFLFITSWLFLTSACPHMKNSFNMSQSNTDTRVILNIMGFFAMTGIYPAGMSYLPASLLAIKHINNKMDILPGYKLKLNAHDTMCDESQGLEAFYKEVYNPNRTSIMTLGATCSHVTEATAQVSTLWNITQISYSSISPHLSNRDIFKTFFRVMTPEQNLTVGRIKIMQEFSWKKVHIVYENFKLFSTLDEYMKQDLDRNQIDVISNEMFTTLKPRDTVLALKKNDARIIILNMYEAQARQIICAMYNLEGSQTWYKKLVWFLPYFYDRSWIYSQSSQDNCSTEQILEVLGNYFSVGSPSYLKDENYRTILNMSASEFYQTYMNGNLYSNILGDIPEQFSSLYSQGAKTNLFCIQRAPEAYDAMWVIALALNNTLTAMIQNKSSVCLEDFRYRNETFWKFLEAGMMKVSFNASTGPFSFNANKERITDIEIWQYVNNNSTSHDGSLVVVGKCQFLEASSWDCRVFKDKVYWASGKVPVDGVQTQIRTLQVDPRIVSTVCGIASLGIVLSLGLLVFNTVHRDHRVIKMSSPRLNNVILVGCILGYSNILVLDIQGEDTGIVCVVRTFTLVLSFSLTFGALFAKTWRVYEIFAAGAKVLNTRMLRDSSLFLIVTILILVNCLTLVGWVVASPQKPSLVVISMTPATENNDVNYTNVFQRCDSTYRRQFTWALVAIQGGVILLGTYLAIQTRKVTFPDLNDSKWIALCIYNVVVLGPIGIVVVMVTEDKPEINYVLEAGMLILVTTMTQCLIFVPKMIAYKKHNRKHTQSLDITFKLRNMDEILGIFTLEPNNLDRDTTGASKPKETSGSCEVSQQTDFSGIACNDTCPCALKDTEINPQENSTCQKATNVENGKETNERTHMSVLFQRINSKHNTNLKPSGLNNGKLQACDYSLDSVNIQRSRSDSSLDVDSASGIVPQGDEPKPPDVESSMGNDDDKVAVFWGNLTLQESNSFSSKHEDSQRLVLDTIKVKAELKVSSKLGLQASWREWPGHLNNAQQICELLSRLKQVVEAGQGEMKT
ncbi:unnamed protein product [Candidula unifasciata]|uniref:G-protein coupled receptors family 3 profile domain-containing protein n=1 Tax=Candidula unifasciata TaxID=100452 RepID=A0A8S3YI56_9EUPU|nr:unnamed protein product [Candidula unifasciata]